MNSIPAWFQPPKLHRDNKHAIIIGAGIAGAQMAWHLCQEGWRVTLIERHNSVATEASGNPAGVITPKMTAQASIGEDFYTRSFHYTLAQLEALKEAGHQIKMQSCGALQLAHNAREVKRWQALKERNLSPDFIQLLNEEETQRIAGIDFHPEQSYKSCYFPKGGWITPASFAETLLDHPHCTLKTETEAISLKRDDKLWQLFDLNNQMIAKSELVIIANGKDLFGFEQSHFLPGMPVAGQTTSATASEFSKKLKTVVGHEGYLTPAIKDDKNDYHIFGATFARDVKNPSIKAESDTENFACLNQYLPNFANSLTDKQSAHVAVRMTTPDRFPYVGALPDVKFYKESYHDLHQGKQWKTYPKAQYQSGLFVLGGLGSRGVITSGYCAKALTDLLENRLESEQTLSLLQHCHPARFLIKNLKRNK